MPEVEKLKVWPERPEASSRFTPAALSSATKELVESAPADVPETVTLAVLMMLPAPAAVSSTVRTPLLVL